MNSKKLSQLIVKGMQEKKGEDIVLMDLKNVKNAVADFFVICTGNSDTQIEAIAESIQDEVEKGSNERAWHKEGFNQKEWILLDFVDVVCHVFKRDRRDFYGLEDLWGDAIIERIEVEVQ